MTTLSPKIISKWHLSSEYVNIIVLYDETIRLHGFITICYSDNSIQLFPHQDCGNTEW